MAGNQPLSVTETDSVTNIEFDRPEKRNALDVEVVTELRDVLVELNEDPTDGILLTGTAPVTTAGADTSIVGGDDEEQKRALIERLNETYEVLQSYPRPTVMAAKGAVIGAGFQLAAMCDFTVAGDETKLSKPEIKYGVFSGYSTAMLRESVGANVAREIALKGDLIPPERALEWGIVSEMVPENEVQERARELTEQLSEYEPAVYKKTKRALQFEYGPDDFENYP